MQIDFHFYAVYALARSAGFTSNHAHKIAYASQHTDDAKYEHALEFENGGRFQQVLSAHKFLHFRAMSKATCYRIWAPFHFLPGNLGVDFYERMACRAGSSVAQRLAAGLVNAQPKPYLLHRLGIFLHVYADTWSHQNFLGLVHERLNDVKYLKVKGETGSSFKAILRELKEEILEYAAPKLGHAQAGTIPDEPFREWRYKNSQGRIFDISNTERALDAAQSCYRVLNEFLEVFPEISCAPPLPWHEIIEKIHALFQTRGSLDQRAAAWSAAISNGSFGFNPEGRDINISYDDREWFRAAVKVDKKDEDEELYERKPGFEMSDWKYFHDAATLHRFTVLHEVLPGCGMICG